MATTIPEVLKELYACAQTLDKVILIVCGLTPNDRSVYTVRQVYKQSVAIAHALINVGVNKGDLVALAVSDPFRWLTTTYGCLMAGTIPLYFDRAFLLKDGSDVLSLLKTAADFKLIVSDPGNHDDCYLSVLENILQLQADDNGRLYSPVFPSLQHFVCERRPISSRYSKFPDLETFVTKNTGESSRTFPEITENDIAALLMTSGSTGRSKMAMMTHKTLLTSGRRICDTLKVSRDRGIYFNNHCLNWMGGYPISLVATGATMCLLGPEVPTEHKQQAVIRAIVSEQCTTSYFSPKFISALLSLSPAPKLPLETLATGGTTVTTSAARACGLMTKELFTIYGSTESALIMHSHAITTDTEMRDFIIGVPYPGAEVKVVDEQEQEVGPEVFGEIYLRDPSMFVGYYNQPEKYEAVMTSDGWYRSGDFGFTDSNGIAFVKGRKGDLCKFCFSDNLNNSSEWAPSDVEKILVQHENIRDVYVKLFRDPDGVVFHCCLETNADMTLHEVMRFINSFLLKSLEFRLSVQIIREFPRTVSGKVDRYSIQKMIDKHRKSTI